MKLLVELSSYGAITTNTISYLLPHLMENSIAFQNMTSEQDENFFLARPNVLDMIEDGCGKNNIGRLQFRILSF